MKAIVATPRQKMRSRECLRAACLAVMVATLGLSSPEACSQASPSEPRMAAADAVQDGDCPPGNGQLESEPAWFTAGKDEWGHRIEYLGQPARGGKLVLTASNGFFSSGIVAQGKSQIHDVANGTSTGRSRHPELIANDFECLSGWNNARQTMQWYLWFSEPGKVQAALHGVPAAGNPQAVLRIRLGEQTQQVAVGDNEALKEGLRFEVTAGGKHALVIQAETADGVEVGRLYTVDVYGPAVKDARLLRARWRPAAVHGGYRCSRMEDTTMWVMATRSLGACSSYSPVTTPFGYYGCTFNADQTPGGGFNFSMWTSPDRPMACQAHLLALGSPQAEFSGFGHEGTGVKPRGWAPLSGSPCPEVVLALRVERGNPYHTYYGYFLDPNTADWRLFCAGRKWVGDGKSEKPLWPGSFVEVPGPPQVQRTGDVVRRVLRKGWCMDAAGQWHRLDVLPSGGGTHVNKSWGCTADGWFCFQMGGLEHLTMEKADIVLPRKFLDEPLPDYLAPEKVKQLYHLPVRFGTSSVHAGRTTAQLTVELEDAGTHASAVVYYGTSDYLTYAPRRPDGTEKQNSVLAGDRFWPAWKDMGKVVAGANVVTLTGLKPGTQYCYRVLVTNDQGKMWTFETGAFSTQ